MTKYSFGYTMKEDLLFKVVKANDLNLCLFNLAISWDKQDKELRMYAVTEA